MGKSEHAVQLTTTLALLRRKGACASGYATLLKGIGGVSFDQNTPINLLTILETNGVADCLWALCATEQNCDKVSRLMAADFAEGVLHLYESQYPGDLRPRLAIEAARAYALGEITAAEASWASWASSEAASWASSEAASWASSEAAAEASRASWASSEAVSRASWASSEAAAEASRAASWASWASSEASRAAEASRASWASSEAVSRASWASSEASSAVQKEIVTQYLLP